MSFNETALANFIDYIPAVLTDWDGGTDPGNVKDALDQLAERVDDLELSSIFGTQFQNGKSLGESSVTGTTAFQTKVGLTTPSLPIGTYFFIWTYNWRYTSTIVDYFARLQIDGGTIGTHTEEPFKSEADQEYLETGFSIESFGSEAAHTVNLQFATEDVGETAYMKNAQVAYWRIT